MSDINSILQNKTSLKTIRLAARVIGTIWLVICLFGFIGFFLEGTKGHESAVPKPLDILGIATISCFILGFFGLIIAWWRAGIGGLISLFGFIITGVLFKINPNYILSPPFFVLILLPSILYLAYWWGDKKSSTGNSGS